MNSKPYLKALTAERERYWQPGQQPIEEQFAEATGFDALEWIRMAEGRATHEGDGSGRRLTPFWLWPAGMAEELCPVETSKVEERQKLADAAYRRLSRARRRKAEVIRRRYG